MSAEDKKPDELNDAYRRASAAEAGHPSDATRRAILAEAQAAARRRQPAANDVRYVMRAVAGIAVIGVALVLWQQMDHRLPGEAPKVEASGAAEQLTPAVKLDTPTPEFVPPAVKMEPSPPAAAASTAPQRQRTQPVSAMKDVAQEAQRADAVADTAAAGGAASGRLERAESLAARAPTDDSDAALLIRFFPQQYNSDTPHSVWLVLDSTGRVLRSGELTADQRLEELAPQIQLQLGGRKLGVWREQTLVNARGQPIRVLTTILP